MYLLLVSRQLRQLNVLPAIREKGARHQSLFTHKRNQRHECIEEARWLKRDVHVRQ
jgi:hypothetical protein